MFQTDQFVANQAKVIESAQALSQLAIESVKAVSDIHCDAAKEALAATQAKATDLVKIKSAKEALEVFKAEDAQLVLAEVTAVQSKVVHVLRKSNHEVMTMLESAINESKADLKKIVKESTKSAPAGSEAFVNTFDYLFDASLQTFDQAYTASKDAFTAFEKTFDDTISSFQSQYKAVKPASKTRKAIAA